MHFWRAYATTIGCAYNHGTGKSARAAKTHTGRLRHQLIHTHQKKACKLNLGYWPQPIDRHADRTANNGRFGKRRIEDSLLAKLLLQVLGNTEDAPVYSDILPKYHNALVSLQFQAECVIESFDHCHLHSLILTSSVLHSAANQPAAPANAVKGRPRCSQRSYQGPLAALLPRLAPPH